jgi:type IV pilus assembly protein PilY1
MNSNRIALSLLIAILGFGAGADTARADALNIAQNPLFLVPPVKPALIMAVDDSGSMDSEVIFESNDGALWWNTISQSFSSSTGELNFNRDGNANGTWRKYVYLFPNGQDGGNGWRRRYADAENDHFAIPPLPQFAFARSPEYNTIYFDPAVKYPPFVSGGSDSFDNVDWLEAPVDEARGSSDPFDLTTMQERYDSNWVFTVFQGMRIPKGTKIALADNERDCPLEYANGDPVDLDDGEWKIMDRDVVLDPAEDECEVAISYYPATFWLPKTQDLPDGFGYRANEVYRREGRAPDGTGMWGYEIKPAHFESSEAFKDAMQNFANWFSYYRKRSLLTRAAIGRSFEPIEFLRTGFFEINDRDAVTMRDLEDSPDRVAFYDWLYQLRGTGGTPNKQAVDFMGEQYDSASGSNAPIIEACQRNFGMLVTDGFSNPWTGANVGNADGGADSPLQGTVLADSQSETIADIAYRYYNTHLRAGEIGGGQVPTPTACNQTDVPLRYDCVDDPHMNFFAVTLGAKGRIFGTEDQPGNPYAEDDIPWPTSFPQRHPSSIDDLWHATLNTRGEMLTAASPEELVEALTRVLQDIESRIQPVGISTSSARIDQQSNYFVAQIDSSAWSGDLEAFRLIDDSFEWSASSRLANRTASRNIVTSIAGQARDFSAASTAVQTALRPEDGEVPAALEDIPMSTLIKYLRGDRRNEEQNGGVLRERDGPIGDIANSRPTYAGPRNEGWGRLGTGYLDYLDETKKERTPMVLIGANDGMMHAFDAENGKELFAYVPSMVHENLIELADPNYSHRFYVDGQVTVADAMMNDSGGWTTVAVGGLGGGGKGIYALDIGDAGGFSTNDVMWEFSDEDDDDVGNVYDEPIVTRLGNGDWVVIFANGFNSVDDQAHLFVIDLRTGDLRNKIELGRAGDNGLSSSAALIDPQSRLYTSRVYAGDLQGNMWRVDFSGSGSPSVAFGGNPLASVDRPIVSPPALAPNPGGGLMVYFGTGKLIETIDRVGEPDDFEQFFAIRDRGSRFNNLNGLAEATIGGTGTNRTVTTDGDTTDGWRLVLGQGSPTGERVLSRPRVEFGQLIFSSFQPLDDVCASGGQRRIYVLDAVSGRGVLDDRCENCAVVDLGAGAPVDPAVIIRPPKLGPTDSGDGDGGDGGGGDGGQQVPTEDNVGSTAGWCSDIVMVIPDEGFRVIGKLCDGRQIWRQVQ